MGRCLPFIGSEGLLPTKDRCPWRWPRCPMDRKSPMFRNGRASFVRRFPLLGLGGGAWGHSLSPGPTSFSAVRDCDNRYAILFARVVRLFLGRQGESAQRSGGWTCRRFPRTVPHCGDVAFVPLFWDTTFEDREGAMAGRSVPFGKSKWRPQMEPPEGWGWGLRRWRRRSGRRCTCSNPCSGACRQRPRRR